MRVEVQMKTGLVWYNSASAEEIVSQQDKRLGKEPGKDKM